MQQVSQETKGSKTAVPAVRMLKRPLGNLRRKIYWLASAALVVGLSAASIPSENMRELASLAFPRHRVTSDVDDILRDYPDYLRFAVEVGRSTDSATARRLSDTYQTLRKRNPQAAARFLKGLRFEMVQKLEFMGLAPTAVTTNTPEIRRWVGRFLKAWYREADEYLFRAIAMR